MDFESRGADSNRFSTYYSSFCFLLLLVKMSELQIRNKIKNELVIILFLVKLAISQKRLFSKFRAIFLLFKSGSANRRFC